MGNGSMAGAKVLIVTNDADTSQGTHDYLTSVGASPEGTTDLEAALVASHRVQAIVIFADDFPKERVLSILARLREGASAQVVVVSEEVELFGSVGGDRPEREIVVLRRPTWGWMLLDALRAQLSDDRTS